MSSENHKLYIKKVNIGNFKIYRNKEFIFDDKSIILITGSNGFGKSTLIDAIEWCLTGSIKRIQNCFDERNTTKTEKNRVDNTKGIIKNANHPNESVKVTITLQLDEEEVEVFREQSEDFLHRDTDLQFTTDIKPETKEQVKELIESDVFYSYHICDTNKGYDFLRCSRQEIMEMFRDFLKSRPSTDRMLKNLNTFVENLTKEKEAKNSLLKPSDEIESKIKQIDEMKKRLITIEYPQEKTFENEILEVDSLNSEKLKHQLNDLVTTGFNISNLYLKQIIEFYESRNKLNVLLDMQKTFYDNKDEICYSINNSFFDKDKLEALVGSVDILQNQVSKIDQVHEVTALQNILKEEIFSDIYKHIYSEIDNIVQLNSQCARDEKLIKEKGQGNEIIAALSDIINARKGILDYKKSGYLNCPLCGSDEYFKSFSEIDDIAQIASEYLDENKSSLATMKIELSSNVKKLSEKVESIKLTIIAELEKRVNNLKELIESFTKSYNENLPFFENLKKMSIPATNTCIRDIEAKIMEIQQSIKDEVLIKSSINTFNKLLRILGISKDQIIDNLDDFKKIKIELSSLCDDSIEISNYDFDLLNQKILYIRNVLSSQEVKEKMDELKSLEQNNININKQIEQINKQIGIVKKLSNEINDTKKELEKQELESVGPYLFNIFNKIIKHSNIGQIKLKRDSARDGGMVLVDNLDNNLLNTLSQGQLGVLVISYFFANMFRRGESTAFKTYFVDDITNCLDDMNLISFVDMIKYLFNIENKVVYQFFFSTCDDNLEKLFIHKLQSFKISGVNFKYNSFANYKRIEF